MPPLVDRILGFLPSAGLIVLATVAAFFALRFFLRRVGSSQPATALAHVLLARPQGGREVTGWLLFCVTLLLALDFRGFTGGFFRQDDFSFLQVAREQGSLGHQLLLYHNDHTLPLFRFEVWALVSLAGARCDSHTMAAWFNAANFLICLGVLLAVVWLLTEMGARRIVIAAACVWLWFWPSWGEFTSGFYTLWMYPQCLALGLASIAAWVRASRLGGGRWICVSLLFVVAAATLGVVGLWIFPTMAAVAWLHRVPRHGLLAAAVLGLSGITAFAFYTRFSEHAYSERERVQNPNATRVHASILPTLREHLVALPFGFLSGVGGSVLSGAIPPVTKGLVPQVAAHNRLCQTLIVVECLVALGLLGALWRLSRRWSPTDRRRVATLLLPLFVLTGMTIVARPSIMQWPALFWPAKYQCIPITSCVLAACFVLECSAFATAQHAHRSKNRIILTLPLAVGATVLIAAFESALHLNIPWFPGGRDANAQSAHIRRADHVRFINDLTGLASDVGQTSLTLPRLAIGFGGYDYLEIGGHPVFGANYIIPDLLAASPATRISLVLTDTANVDATILGKLREFPELTRLFLPVASSPALP